jgi:hypothetical protein
MKNRRRRLRRQKRAYVRAVERWYEAERANPSEANRTDANVDELLLDYGCRRCNGCAGRGWRERRHKPTGRVVCRVCQGYGRIPRWSLDGRIKPAAPSKVYWTGRWPPRWARH